VQIYQKDVMQSSAWNELLRRIPASQYNNLMLTTASGIEIALQAVVRAEKEFLVVRGRQTGTTEGGGFFFIPFDQVLFLGFQRLVQETEVRSWFGDTMDVQRVEENQPTSAQETVPVAADTPNPSQAERAAPPTGEIPRPSTTPAPESAKSRPMGATNKAALLERLRSRRSDSNPVI
jgi:hypothetical protein